MTTDLPERLPTRPLRNWLLAWRIWTGDPPEVIAQGLNLDPALVAELLGPRPPLMLDRTVAEALGELISGRVDARFEAVLEAVEGTSHAPRCDRSASVRSIS